MTLEDNDLTKLAGGTPAAAGKVDVFGNVDILAGHTKGDGSQHVNFIDASGHVHELYRSPDPAAQWADSDLTKLADGIPASGSALAGYAQGDGSRHAIFVDADGHVHELYRSS